MSIKRLAGETAVYGVSSILGRLLNFVLITPFVTQPEVMSPEQYGVVSELFFYTAFLLALLVFRLDTAVFRFASRAEYSATAVCRKAQLLVLGFVLLICGGGLVFATPLAGLMAFSERVEYIQLFLLIVAFDALSAVPLARLRLEQRAWTFAGVNLANIVLNIFLIYTLLQFIPAAAEKGRFAWFDAEQKVSYYFLAVLLASILRYLLLLADRLWQWRKEREKVGTIQENIAAGSGLEGSFLAPSAGAKFSQKSQEARPPQSPAILTMLRYASPLVVVGVAGIINTLAGPAMIKWLYSNDLEANYYWAGQYGAAMKMAVFLTLFTTAYNFAAEPFFFRQAGSDLSKADRHIYAQAMRVFALVNAVAIAGILLLMPLVQLYLGRDLREGLVVLPYLMAANFLLGIYHNLSVAYKLTDQTLLGGGIALAGTGVFLLTNWFLLPIWGITAPALATFLCFLLMCILAYGVSRKYFPVPYPWWVIGRYALLTALFVGIGWPLESLLLRALLLLVYLAIMLASEWRMLRRLGRG